METIALGDYNFDKPKFWGRNFVHLYNNLYDEQYYKQGLSGIYSIFNLESGGVFIKSLKIFKKKTQFYDTKLISLIKI